MTPETFEHELHTRLGRDYRLRWSPLQSAWCIEQHIGRGVWELPENDWDDRAIRARDGYALVCTVQPKPFIICPECKLRVDIPELTIGEAHCTYCEARTGERVSWFVGYFPLGEKLLQRLERTSPKRAGKWQKEMAEKNAATAAALDRQIESEKEAILLDYRNRIADIPQTGYGGIIASQGQS